jgi:hypothetical protein
MWTRLDSCAGKLRRALALPIYTVALILSFASDLLRSLAAKIAGDDWPE